jgi:hypothetical protein
MFRCVSFYVNYCSLLLPYEAFATGRMFDSQESLECSHIFRPN